MKTKIVQLGNNFCFHLRLSEYTDSFSIMNPKSINYPTFGTSDVLKVLYGSFLNAGNKEHVRRVLPSDHPDLGTKDSLSGLIMHINYYILTVILNGSLCNSPNHP